MTTGNGGQTSAIAFNVGFWRFFAVSCISRERPLRGFLRRSTAHGAKPD